MPQLDLRDADGATTTRDLDRPELILGRQPDCDIVLSTQAVSRRHARLTRLDDGRWEIADLGSSHGVNVNSRTVQRHVLTDGDVIKIVDWTLTFKTHSTGVPVATIPRMTSSDASELTGPLTPAERAEPEVVETRRVDEGALMRTTLVAQKLDLSELSTTQRPAYVINTRDQASENQLLALIRISDEINRCADVESICRTAVTMALRATKADRGTIALREGRRFVPKAGLVSQKTKLVEGPVRFSKTFAERVVREKQAMIAKDVEQDEALSSAKSIVALDIRSVVAVPLLDGEDVLGFLYLDRIGRGTNFGARDLDLLCLIGYHAAAAIGRSLLMERVRQEEDRRRTLSRFFSADVIRHLDEARENGTELTSTRAQVVTVLFCDIAGFTAKSERVDPADLRNFLESYFDRMIEIVVDRHGGTLDKYIGDALMTLFGAPYTKGAEADARAAVAAALDMIDAVPEIRARFPAWHDLDIRIGINTGRVVAGELGSPRRREYSVIGDAVNVASRLESTGEPGRIQIGDITAAAVKDLVELEFAGERKVKNREQPVRSWWVRRR